MVKLHRPTLIVDITRTQVENERYEGMPSQIQILSMDGLMDAGVLVVGSRSIHWTLKAVFLQFLGISCLAKPAEMNLFLSPRPIFVFVRFIYTLCAQALAKVATKAGYCYQIKL